MAGAFAHISAVNIATGSDVLDSFNLNSATYDSLGNYFEYVELGSVSPDYPYLAIASKHATWADLMHLELKTKTMIDEAVTIIKTLEPEQKDIAFAWLCGFVSHIVTDVVIHPIVELKVGPYQGNEEHHRICEMHQDAYIYQRLNLGGIGAAEHLETGIGQCSDIQDKDKIDPIIKDLWRKMLKALNLEVFEANTPEIDTWHERFMTIVSLAEEADNLFALARHVAVGKGLTYPKIENIDNQYIYALKIPDGKSMDYDDIFDKTVAKIGESWKKLGDAVYTDSDDALSYFGNWDLDTGRDKEDNLIYWT